MSDDEINDLQCHLHFLAELLRGGNPTKACATVIMPEGEPGKTPTWIELLFRAFGTAHYMGLDTAPLFRLNGPGEATLAMVGDADAILSQILLARQLDKVKELHCEQPFADLTLLDHMGIEEKKTDKLALAAKLSQSPDSIAQPATADGAGKPNLDGERKLREPSAHAIAAYRAVRFLGNTQGDVAGQLRTNQGQVSRWVKEVAAWLEAGNVLPHLPGLATKPQSIDPDVIDMGERQDGRTPRQRHRFDRD